MTTSWRRAVILSYFIVSDHLLLCLVSSQYAPDNSYQHVDHYSSASQADQYPDYYHYEPNQVYSSLNGIDRQGIQASLASPGAGVIQFGALIILGGAAVITGVQAANTNRDLNTVRSRFITICNAVKAAGAVHGISTPTMDPIAQEALRKINAVSVALGRVGPNSCNF